MKRAQPEILVRRKGTRQIVHRVTVNPLTARRIDKVVAGMEINISADYFVDDTPARQALAEAEKAAVSE